MNLLDRLQLSFRCPAHWEEMEGDDRKRFCSHCRKHVHNLSEMTRDEAENLISRGGACIRMIRRADGTTVVKDCPRTRSARRLASQVAGAGLAGSALALASCAKRDERPPVMGEHPPLTGIVALPPGPPAGDEVLLGEPIAPEPPPLMGRPKPPDHGEGLSEPRSR
ncbi:hypothetical protein HAHE_03440 [Haloferula helveola]|uniref:Uncharacterized protein n=1 Tax=Haloferula helveola TaxID=490095 RepID=A0ABN6GYP9_9BACT|nr:hypothetical protein HAHE_03440 [Haloferula helveola]